MDAFLADRSPSPISTSISMKNVTVTLSTARTVSIDTTPTTTAAPQTTILKALPETIPINSFPITNIIHQAIPSNIIPTFHERVSSDTTVRATEVILPEMKPVNIIVSPEMIPINDTTTAMKSITDHLSTLHSQSVALANKKLSNATNPLFRPITSIATTSTVMNSSPEINAKIAEESFLIPYLKSSQKIHNNDGLNMQLNNIQLKVSSSSSSSISPIITYDQSAPKTRLDQWKWEMNQQQQQQPLINQSQIDNSNSDNRNNTVNNSNTILLSSISLISSFLLLFSLNYYPCDIIHFVFFLI